MASPGIIRRLFAAGLFLTTLVVAFSYSAGAAAQDEETEERATVNLEIILDASGSMAEEIEPGVTRIDAAKEALQAIIEQLPPQEGVNIGLRVYGHKGANNEAGRAESCLSTELKVPVLGVDTEKLSAEIDSYSPVGWTPLSLALQSSELDFPEATAGQINAVVLMTDGLETCGGDPCAISRQLRNGPKAITTHVIGFALAPDEQEELQCVVDSGGGLLLGAGNAAELNEAMTLILSDLDVLQTTGFLEIEQVGGVFPAATATGGPQPSTLNPEPEVTTVTFSEGNVLEVPAGSYALSWANPSGQETAINVVVIPGETTLVRGSLIKLPLAEETPYRVSALDGTVVWEGPVGFGDVVWVLPGTYRLEAIDMNASTVLLSMAVQTVPGTVTDVSVSTVD